MNIKQTLDSKIANHNLLNHPFYQAWSTGELPTEALRSYAREYGAFIATVPQGWEAVGDAETAAEEIEHIDLWADFATGLDTNVSQAEIPQVKRLSKPRTHSLPNLRQHSVPSTPLRHSNPQLHTRN